MKEEISVEEALTMIKASLHPVAEVVRLPIMASYGRVAAEPIRSRCDVPPHDNAAVDGYGIAWKTGVAAVQKGTVLPVVAEAVAGEPLRMTLTQGQAVRVFTGACLSAIDGLDTIVMREHCQEQKDGRIMITETAPLQQGANYRLRGEDVTSGQIIIKKGCRLRPQDMGLLAAGGHAEVPVFRSVRVALFSNGDELREPHESSLSKAQIYDSNRYSLKGLLTSAGAEVTDLGILADDADTLKQKLERAAACHDLLITSGGVAASERDCLGAVIQRYGSIAFWRLRMKPGRPLLFGSFADTPLLALPGNPVAVMVTFMIFVRLALHVLSGRHWQAWRRYPLKACFQSKKKKGRREWRRATLKEEQGTIIGVDIVQRSGAGILSSVVEADGLVDLAEDIQHVTHGDSVYFTPFTEFLW